MKYYTAYVLTGEGRERFTGILACSEDHACSIASALWTEKHCVGCFFCVSVSMDDLG